MLIDFIAHFYAPYLCVGCGTEGKALICPTCAENIPRIPPRCFRCKQVSRGYRTCEACRRRSSLHQVLAFAPYAEEVKLGIRALKYERAQGVAKQFTSFLGELTGELDGSYVLVPAPTATHRVRQRGYDQAELIAKRLAHQQKTLFSVALARRGRAHQVGADRAQRMRQVKGAFWVRRPRDIKGKHVVLVDDIITTGATLEEAARALKRAGAQRVSAIVVAQA